MYGCWVVLLFNVHTDNNALHIRVYNSVVLYYNTAWMQVAENSKDDKVCTTRLWRQVSQLSALSARSIFVVNIISSYHLDWSLPELRRVELTLTYYYSCAQGGGWDWCLLLWGRGQEAVVWHIISAEGTTLNTAFKLVLGGSTHTLRPKCERIRCWDHLFNQDLHVLYTITVCHSTSPGRFISCVQAIMDLWTCFGILKFISWINESEKYICEIGYRDHRCRTVKGGGSHQGAALSKAGVAT